MNREILMNELEPGMIFTTKNPMMLGRAICWFEKLRSADNQAEYSHAGVIIGRPAITFEALWTNKKQNLFKAYAGTKVLIGRHKDMTPKRAVMGWDGVKKYEGQVYSFWRLLLHALPFCSKIGTGGFAVCSEIAAKYISKSGVMVAGKKVSSELVAEFLKTGESFYWKGRTPDDIADMIHNFKGWSVVFEGILP
uniref:Peptidase n=1 Tax=viral metagenome TaxID=1070528 RepID=A0A6H2A4J0_9ZZZZ